MKDEPLVGTLDDHNASRWKRITRILGTDPSTIRNLCLTKRLALNSARTESHVDFNDLMLAGLR